jgi:hypothetical protein
MTAPALGLGEELPDVCEPFRIFQTLPDAAALDHFLFVDPNPANRAGRLRFLLAEMERAAAHLRVLLAD